MRGTANVFEAVFFLEVRDVAGVVLGRKRVVASAGTGTRGTFDVSLTFTAAASGPGALIAFTYSAKDGSRQVEMRVPVELVAP